MSHPLRREYMEADIADRRKLLPVFGKVKGFQTKGGKSGKAAKDTSKEKGS